MSESRLRIKFGDHEFEAEGSTESVERQLEIFKRLVVPGAALKAGIETTQESAADQAPLSLEKIMDVQGRTVSLRAAAKVEDALLLLLLGQRQFRQHHILSGAEVMHSLRQSGLEVQRADIALKRLAVKGNVIAIGRYRARRYQLSKSGLDGAEQIARRLISQAAPSVDQPSSG